jgi:uncharacterized protein (UPF0248 family)
MQPIHELLNRIKWDKEFGSAEFSIGYYDRVEHDIVIIPLKNMEYENPAEDGFQLVDAEGKTVTVPFHRVREVYRDGRLIWKRHA